jgi:hypothetical protein
MSKIIMILGIMVMLTSGVYAQENELISAENLGRLQSVQHIDYADFDADIEIGWFIANDVATEFVVFDNDSNLYRMADDSDITEIWRYIDESDEQLFAVIDGTFAFEEFYLLYIIDGNYWIDNTPFMGEGVPLALDHDDNALYVEAQIDSELVVYQLNESLMIQSEFIIPSDASQPIMRVGRLRLPIIVQSSFDGGIDIFYFDSLMGRYEILDAMAVFGNINADTTHFAWSDPNSTYLNLLDIETGENKIIANLNGAYAQYYLLSHDASLIIAVNVNFVSNVIAWDVNTGTRYDLGAYRECKRIPDKVKLSADGTTLIIGCDTGLELWRIVDEMETD